jgi:hypothetical protein
VNNQGIQLGDYVNQGLNQMSIQELIDVAENYNQPDNMSGNKSQIMVKIN